MKTKINLVFSVFMVVMLLFTTGCRDEKKDPFEIYHGTLTVLQKDAYSEVAGRNNILWPPHTTTVFKWNNGEEVQLNHGTAPDEVDDNGEVLLDEIKVYSFQGSKEDLETLEEMYNEAICDSVDGQPNNTFLSLVEGKQELAKVVLQSLGDFITDDANNFAHDNLSKKEVLEIVNSGDVSRLMPLLSHSGQTVDQLNKAFFKILSDSFAKLGHDIKDFHVCNNDADLQVKIVKNFNKTGKAEMPERKCEGPMVFYFPN